MTGVVEHIEENYILPTSTALLFPYCSAFDSMRSRNQQRPDSSTTTDPYTGEQLPKPILTTCTFDCDYTSYPITPSAQSKIKPALSRARGYIHAHALRKNDKQVPAIGLAYIFVLPPSAAPSLTGICQVGGACF
jgi:hypothetical protein